MQPQTTNSSLTEMGFQSQNDPGSHPNIDRKQICVIGAGPSGLAALKVIKDTQQYKTRAWTLTAFEARENIGGVWLPALPTPDDLPPSPLYDSLTTNLPHPLMAYTDFVFPPSTLVFPPASIVQDYLLSYADQFGLVPHIRLNTTVKRVERYLASSPGGQTRWKVAVSTGESFVFDLVIVCNGHHRLPRYPDIPGIQHWLERGRAVHSAWYRHPNRNMGNTILVVGDGPSGRDISNEVLSVSQTVIHSVRGAKNEHIAGGKLKIRGGLVRFAEEREGKVVFEDGTVESGIDYCILATGYQVSLPFLDSIIQEGIPPPLPPIPSGLYNTTYSVFPLARHIFPLQDPTLTFIGLPVRVIPFPLAEAQARAIIHVFTHPSSFDPARESVDILSRYDHLRTQLGTNDPHKIAKSWMVYDDAGAGYFDYRDSLFEFAKETFGGVAVKAEKWERIMTANRKLLAVVWKGLVESGDAEEWVKGVGEAGKEEWVRVLERMLDRARQMGLPVVDDVPGVCLC